MNDMEKNEALTEDQRKYLETVSQLPEEAQANAASFAAGLLAASKINNHPAA